MIRVRPSASRRSRALGVALPLTAGLAWLAVGVTVLSVGAFASGTGVLLVTVGLIEAALPGRAVPRWMVTHFRRLRGALTIVGGAGMFILGSLVTRGLHHGHINMWLAYVPPVLLLIGTLGESALDGWAQRRQRIEALR